MSTSNLFEPTRSAALARLQQFLPRAGAAYSNSRNYDNGARAGAFRENVSQLSPWLHAGLLSEEEVLDAVLAQHGHYAADKFVSEVFWRIYFKGYFEQRPTIWPAFSQQRDGALRALETNSGLNTAYQEAVEGRTGIGAFDHWVRELVDTGYLHNHARMWFASIWIFTLKLDWTLGADFFLRHLIDGDAASNTLSWRWVGGLHTKGKTYLARADNLARYTANMEGGPLDAEGLSNKAEALQEDADHGRKPFELSKCGLTGWTEDPYALILHDEGASHVPLKLPTAPKLIIGAARPEARSPLALGKHARRFSHEAVSNGVEAAAAQFGCDAVIWSEGDDLAQLLGKANLSHAAYKYIPVGWTRDALTPHLSSLIENGSAIPLLDDLARTTWPEAKAGFFGVKKKIESLLDEVGICGDDLEAAE